MPDRSAKRGAADPKADRDADSTIGRSDALVAAADSFQSEMMDLGVVPAEAVNAECSADDWPGGDSPGDDWLETGSAAVLTAALSAPAMSG